MLWRSLRFLRSGPLTQPSSQNGLQSLVGEPSYTVVDGHIVITLPVSNARAMIQESQPIVLDFKSMKPVHTPVNAVVMDGFDIACQEDSLAELLVERDDDYYLSMICFEVEDTQFQVPRWRFLQDSELLLPQDQNGDCTTNLPDVSAQDFRGMMEFMYPQHSLIAGIGLSKEDWISVLKLSTQWKMLEFRKKAIARFTGTSFSVLQAPYILSPEEDVLLGRTYGIPSWYRRGCIAFAENTDLEPHHQGILGIETMVKLMQVRDQVYARDMQEYNQRFSVRSLQSQSALPTLFGDDARPVIPPVPLIERVIMARNSGNTDQLLSCYHQLTEREESFSLREVELLTLKTTLELWRERFKLLRRCRHILEQAKALPTFRPDVGEAVDKEFWEDFEAARKLANLFDNPPPDSRSDSPCSGLPAWAWPPSNWCKGKME